MKNKIKLNDGKIYDVEVLKENPKTVLCKIAYKKRKLRRVGGANGYNAWPRAAGKLQAYREEGTKLIKIKKSRIVGVAQ